ncbi:MAG: BadF/BadG/BcrA/BcrD ATPase family protein [Cyanobium sp.]
MAENLGTEPQRLRDPATGLHLGKQTSGPFSSGLRSQDSPGWGGWIAGFDAGQTHTTCRLAAADGTTVAEGQGPGVCHLAAEGGARRFQAALRLSLADARSRLSPPGQEAPLHAAAVGASGIEQGSTVQAEGLALAAAALGLAEPQLTVTGDERTALRGAFPDGAGIVVISGTGTIAVGRDGRDLHQGGREHRCAGWGWLLDGAGSAMDIGRDGLALSLQMADGRRCRGPLLEALWQALALNPGDPQAPQTIKALVVRPEFGPAGFARLAPAVAEVAGSGDREAQVILRRHGEALASSVAGVARVLGLATPPVAALGGAITHLEGLRQAFDESLNQQLPGAQLQEPAGDACSGALAMARELVGE